MTTRRPTRLRVIVCLTVLLTMLGLDLESPALARSPYRELYVTEGDPGDGVLRPSVDPRDEGSGGGTVGSQPPVQAEQPSTGTSTWAGGRFAAEFRFVPVYLPGGATGPGTMIILPRTWSRHALPRLIRDGRWHHVP